MSLKERDQLRAKQDRIVAICKERGFPMDAPISDLQLSAPNAQELSRSLWPDFVSSMDSFLSEFDKSNWPKFGQDWR